MENEKIIVTGTMGTRYRQPYIIINYHDNEKQLPYFYGMQIELYKSVDLTIAKGLFGFDILVKSELKTD